MIIQKNLRKCECRRKFGFARTLDMLTDYIKARGINRLSIDNLGYEFIKDHKGLFCATIIIVRF